MRPMPLCYLPTRHCFIASCYLSQFSVRIMIGPHYLVATREVTPDGFGAVNREWARAEVLREWRMEWEAAAEVTLERTGVLEREAAAEGG
jgi:hypothetical protein